MSHRVGCFVLLVLLVLVLGAGQASALSYQARASYATGENPVGVAVGDLSGDGLPDLVTSNVLGDSVSVFLGTGSGAFGAKTDFATGDDPFAVAVGDVSGDGKADIVTADRTPGKVSVLLGDGAGAFGAKTDYSVGVSPMGVKLADLNGDGRLDIVVNNNGCNSVGVLLGTGSGAFAPVVRTNTALGPWSLAVGDVNGDGHLDVVTANVTSSSVSVFPGTGAGGFGTRVDLTAAAATCVAVGDVNGDGALDIVTGDRNLTASVWLGTGTGGFSARTTFATGVDRPIWISLPDLNGDGARDLVLTNGASATASVFVNLGTGSFGPAILVPTGQGASGVLAEDLNDDAKLDLVTADNGAQTVSVLLGEFEAPSGSMTVEAGSAATGTRLVRVGSAVAEATQMRLRDQGGQWSPWVTYAHTAYWSLPGSDGTKVVEAQYRNRVDATAVLSDSIVLDMTAPVTSDDAPAGWRTTSPVTVALTPDDGSGSGVARTQYKVDGDASWSTGTSVAIDGDGVHTLRYRSVDAAGNVEETQFATVRVDATAPVLSIAGVDDAWHAGPVLALISASDGASGPAGASYALDDAGWTPGYGVLVTLEGDHTLKYKATDVAGNATGEQTAHVKIDLTAPVTTAGDDAAWTNKAVTIDFAPVDALSGMAGGRAGTQYSLDGGASWHTGSAATVDPDPTGHSTDGQAVLYRSTDNAGNLEATRSCVARLDTRRPVTSGRGRDGDPWQEGRLQDQGGRRPTRQPHGVGDDRHQDERRQDAQDPAGRPGRHRHAGHGRLGEVHAEARDLQVRRHRQGRRRQPAEQGRRQQADREVTAPRAPHFTVSVLPVIFTCVLPAWSVA